MNSRRIGSLVEALVSDRRPHYFKVKPTDANLMRVAIAMSACRPKDRGPTDTFTEHLLQELAVQVNGTDPSPAGPAVRRRVRFIVGAAAAFSTLGGTVVATTSVEHALAVAPVPEHVYSQLLRIGAFESEDGHVIGEIAAYRGDPSWVFMSIRAPGVSGTIHCQIEMQNGQTEAAGVFVVQNGVGDWARPIAVDVDRIRGATLVTSEGSVLATASFTES
jgi:hypothetical protein